MLWCFVNMSLQIVVWTVLLSSVEKIHSVGTINNVETSYFYCLLKKYTMWCTESTTVVGGHLWAIISILPYSTGRLCDAEHDLVAKR